MQILTNNIPEGFLEAIWFLFQEYGWMFFTIGMRNTLIIALSGTVIGLFLAILIAPFKIQTIDKRDDVFSKLVKGTGVAFSTIYVELLRGTPMIVQAIIIYYGLYALGFRLPVILWGILIVSINTSAYITEVLRGSINAIDKGQMEAARSIGMTRSQAMIHIIIPQAIKNSIPAIGNEFVINIKDTAVLSVISVTELFFIAKRVNSIYYRQTEGFVIAAILYLLMTIPTTQLLYFIARLIGQSKKSYPTSQSF